MSDTQVIDREDDVTRIIDSVEDLERSALEAVRDFVATVNDAFPDLAEDGPRRSIIDSAFEMTEELVGASNDLARKMVRLTKGALSEDQTEAPPAYA